MKSVLLHVQDDDGLEARLQSSLDIVRASEGHLTCLHVTPINAYVAFDNFGGVFVMTDVLKALEEQELKMKERIQSDLANEGVSWDYVQATADPSQAIVQHSYLSDLIVMSHPPKDKRQSLAHALIGDVVMAARTPVLVVPDTAKGVNASGAAVIAWNGSFEAAHALRGALPLLTMASAIHIVSVAEDKDHEFPSVTASEYLSRHGLSSELHETPVGGQSVEQALSAVAGLMNAQYIVMGAYGHSRAREYLFGGVTRSMLRESPVALFLAR
jgi:nucleotide-binding universal stress UspA family protein